jgi:hypothetical protein
MSNFESSPQLKAVKSMFDTITSFNLDKVETLFSKNYQYEALHGPTDLAKLDREKHAEVIRMLWSGTTKLDVSTQQWRIIFNPADRYPTPRSLITRSLKLQGRLSSTFVPLSRTVASSQAVICNRSAVLSFVPDRFRGRAPIGYCRHRIYR